MARYIATAGDLGYWVYDRVRGRTVDLPMCETLAEAEAQARECNADCAQRSEHEIKAKLDYEYVSAETAYGRTVPVPFSIRVF